MTAVQQIKTSAHEDFSGHHASFRASRQAWTAFRRQAVPVLPARGLSATYWIDFTRMVLAVETERTEEPRACPSLFDVVSARGKDRRDSREDIPVVDVLVLDAVRKIWLREIASVQVVVIVDALHCFDHGFEVRIIVAVDERPGVEITGDQRIAPVDGNSLDTSACSSFSVV